MARSKAPSTELIVDNLLRSTGLLIRRIRAEHPHELSIPQSQAMARLEERGPMTTADLARAEAVRPQSMGATLAPLEDEALIVREPHPTDGRQFLFRLTPKGLETRRRNKDAKRIWLMAAIGRLPPQEQQTLAAAADLMRNLTEQ
jgi:DNA-binding MarR family transcriptional regulator